MRHMPPPLLPFEVFRRFARAPEQPLRCSGHAARAQDREHKARVPQAPQRREVDAPHHETVQGSIAGMLSAAR